MHGLMSYAASDAHLLLAQVEVESSNSVWEGWGSVFFVTTLAVLIAALIALGIWQGFKTYHVRAAVSQDQAFQKLAEQATAAQEQLVQSQNRLVEDLADVRARVGEIERILREVE